MATHRWPSSARKMRSWTLVHGLAELVLSDYIPMLTDDPNSPKARAERDALFRRLLEVHLVPR